MKKQYIIPIFVPHLGCPNDCVFCNQKSISGQTKQITKEDVKNIIEEHNLDINYPQDVIEEVEIQIKYEGYIKKIEREAEKMLKNEEKQIPTNIDYDKIPNLASEARQKLKEVRPLNIAQAIRISGVNPADISILLVYLRKQYNE